MTQPKQQVVSIQRGRYKPVGHCIYCGEREGKLTLEHIIPYGLLGRLELPEASCSVCQDIIHPMETWLQTKLLGHVRYRLELPPRKKRPRPATHPMVIKKDDGGQARVEVPLSELPRLMTLPFLPPPPLLLDPGVEPSRNFSWWTTQDPDDLAIFARTHGQGGHAFIQNFLMDYFVRVIAKIAHGAVWGGIDQDLRATFTMLLPDIITGKQLDWLPFIGGDEEEDAPPEEFLNVIEPMIVPMGDKEYLVVRVRLFAPMQAPSYYAVAGVRDVTRQ